MRAFVKRHYLLVGFALIALLSVCYFILNFSLGFFPYDRVLAARTRWEEARIENYRAVVDAQLPQTLGTRYAITVRDGGITEASSRFSLMSDDYPFQPIALEEASDYTIDRLFERVTTALEGSPGIRITSCSDTKYEVDFDTDLGYVNHFASYPGGGFWGCTLGTWHTSIQVIEFEVLPED